MNNNNVYSLNNFDFLARSFARMQAEGRPVDIQAVTGSIATGFASVTRFTASRRLRRKG